MPYPPRREFLKAWFPSLADHKDPAAFFHTYNEFLSAAAAGGQSVLSDKLLLAAALQNAGVHAPATILIIRNGRFISPSDGELSQAEAFRLLDGRGAFIKSRTGWGGAGAFRLHADGTIRKTDGSKMRQGLPELLTRIGRMDYVVQEVLRQDDRFSAVARASVNTVRCVTFRDRSGKIQIAAATWRMGDGRAVVDNGSSGGIVCGIDPATGRIMGPGRTLAGDSHETHPSSGFRFEGAGVPGIDAIFETAKAAHRAFGSLASVGWDVAMTPDGPLIIEGNDPWGARGHVLVDDDFERRAWELFMADRKVAGSGFPQERRPARKFQMIRVTLSIRGKVQKVGYRGWVSELAQDRGVRADADNLDDGSVRCKLTGQRWRVEFLTLACHHGPAAAAVDAIDVPQVRIM